MHRQERFRILWCRAVPAKVPIPPRNRAPAGARSADAQRDRTYTVQASVFAFVLLNMLCIVGFVLAFYDIYGWRDYRVIAPHLLLSLLLLIGCGARQWFAGYAAVSILLGIIVVPQFHNFHSPRFDDRREAIDAVARDVAGKVEFAAGAPAWDNTILMHVEQVDVRMLGLPYGVGIAVVYDWAKQAWPPRSEYVLLRDQEAAKLDVSATMHKVATTACGDIYARRH